MEKERKRRKTYYVPSQELSGAEKKKRNVLNRERVRKFREKKRQQVREDDLEQNVGSPPESSGYESGLGPSTSENRLFVRMNFPSNRRAGTRKRISRALSKAHRELKHVRNKYEDLRKKVRTLQRRNQRRGTTLSVSQESQRSQAKIDIRKAGLSRQQGNKVRRQLTLGNALLMEIKRANEHISKKKGKVGVLKSIVCGKIIKKKYKGLRWLSSRTGLGLNRIGNEKGKWKEVSKLKRTSMQQRYCQEVYSFLERDDISRSQPGKAVSVKTHNNEKKQTRVLTDYLSNLHSKFTSENPTITISLATFCRMRPKHILLTQFISRSSCLCTKHQNMALVLKSLKKEGVNVSANPENYIKSDTPIDNDLTSVLPDKIRYGQWKRVQVTEKGKIKSVMRIVETEADKTTFLVSLNSQTEEFKEHVFRVKKQYDEIRQLKQNLPKHHVILQMDFAENYSCKSVEEIQSAYWNQTSVTLHPVVVYFRDINAELGHKSIVVVSDELAHSSVTVHGILDVMIKEVKNIDPEVEMIHYWTDGPTSQYRNKQVFYTVANHDTIYGMKARWNYFEVGHGKGPCDGLGGTTKRMADEAVRGGKVIIQDASDFYKWAVDSNMKGVKFVFVSSEQCVIVAEILAKRNAVALRGTFKLHAVIGLGENTVAVKDTSCYCQTCLENNMCINGWITHCLKPKPPTKQIRVIPKQNEKDINEKDRWMKRMGKLKSHLWRERNNCFNGQSERMCCGFH